MMVEATERAAEPWKLHYSKAGRLPREAMARIADAGSANRFAGRKQRVSRDDVLAAMQDELDNLPIFVPPPKKDIRLQRTFG